MDPQTLVKHTHNTITTPDGASLSYYTIGSGAGIIILHGAMMDGLGHLELAELLSSSYTVHLLSRRGRGGSDPYPNAITSIPALLPLTTQPTDKNLHLVTVGGASFPRTYDRRFSRAVIEVDLSDINLLLETTKAEYIVGESTGAILTLAAFLSPLLVPALACVKKAIIFEPPLQFTELDTGLDVRGIKRYEEDMAAGDIPGALVSAMHLVQLGPGWIPRVVMKFLMGLMVAVQEKRKRRDKTDGEEGDGGTKSMADMAPILRYDFAVAEEMVGEVKRFEGVAGERKILLLTGEKSPRYLKVATDELEKDIEGAERMTIPGVGHEVLCNSDFRGSPKLAVETLKTFFG
jgi:pimeloyl-ACP methyl ester carboxylesterase